MTVTELISSAQEVLLLLGDYSNAPDREMLLDPMVYGYLQGRFGAMQRQHRLYVSGSSRPKRIDFRHGTSNPAVIEFAVRPPRGGGQLHGSQNVRELRKLTRVPQRRAKRRMLLLLDLYRRSIPIEALKPTYDVVNAGPGRFRRHSVRVVYVHRDESYHFLWRPRTV